MNKPSDRAMRVAERIYHDDAKIWMCYSNPDQAIQEIARIIDREMGESEAIKALQKIEKIFKEEDEGCYILQLIKGITEKALRNVGDDGERDWNSIKVLTVVMV